ncbi:MAG: hypothetical protein FJZ04_03150 [Candidatus Moranbacteria bacterium]|nr:hypothetical protein [Candidatus Moranbacteria bacterium]
MGKKKRQKHPIFLRVRVLLDDVKTVIDHIWILPIILLVLGVLHLLDFFGAFGKASQGQEEYWDKKFFPHLYDD